MSFQAAFKELVHYSLTYVELRIIISYGVISIWRAHALAFPSQNIKFYHVLHVSTWIHISFHLIFLAIRTTSKLTFTLQHHNTFLFLDAIVRVSVDQHKTGPPSFGAKTIVFEYRRNILIFSHINPPKTNVNKQENEL